MLNVEVRDKYRLKSDGMQIVIQRKHVIDPTQSPNFKECDDATKREKWRNWKYCGSVERALEIIAQQNVYESDAKTLDALLLEISDFRREISRLLRLVD